MEKRVCCDRLQLPSFHYNLSLSFGVDGGGIGDISGEICQPVRRETEFGSVRVCLLSVVVVKWQRSER